MQDYPTWAKLVSQVGFPILMAVILVQVLIGQTRDHDVKLNQHIENTQKINIALGYTLEQLMLILKAECLNKATDVVMIQRCSAVQPLPIIDITGEKNKLQLSH